MNERVIELSRLLLSEKIKPKDYRSRMIAQFSYMSDEDARELACGIMSRNLYSDESDKGWAK